MPSENLLIALLVLYALIPLITAAVLWGAFRRLTVIMVENAVQPIIIRLDSLTEAVQALTKGFESWTAKADKP